MGGNETCDFDGQRVVQIFQTNQPNLELHEYYQYDYEDITAEGHEGIFTG